MKTKHDDWKVLPLFIAVVIAGIFSSTLSSVLAASISELTIEDRLTAVRKYIKFRREENTDLFDTSSSAQDNLEADSKDKQLSWANWGNWRNWRNWGNWPNWANWGNWWG